MNQKYETAEILIDGFTDEEKKQDPEEAYLSKKSREKKFPKSLMKMGLTCNITEGQAAMPADKIHILNALADASVKDLNKEPNMKHPQYETISRILRATFAVAVLPRVLADAEEIGDSAALPLASVIAADTTRTFFQMEVSESMTQENLDLLATALSKLPNLLSISLRCLECPAVTSLDTLGKAVVTLKKLKTLDLTFPYCNKISSLSELSR